MESDVPTDMGDISEHHEREKAKMRAKWDPAVIPQTPRAKGSLFYSVGSKTLGIAECMLPFFFRAAGKKSSFSLSRLHRSRYYLFFSALWNRSSYPLPIYGRSARFSRDDYNIKSLFFFGGFESLSVMKTFRRGRKNETWLDRRFPRKPSTVLKEMGILG